MSDAGFTEGDWSIAPIEDSKEHLRIRGTVLGGRYKIANVIDLKDHHNESLEWCKREREESMANAHLITAAPEMYEMLEQAAAILDNIWKNTGSLGAHNKSAEIQLLLAKARGEQ